MSFLLWLYLRKVSSFHQLIPTFQGFNLQCTQNTQQAIWRAIETYLHRLILRSQKIKEFINICIICNILQSRLACHFWKQLWIWVQQLKHIWHDLEWSNKIWQSSHSFRMFLFLEAKLSSKEIRSWLSCFIIVQIHSSTKLTATILLKFWAFHLIWNLLKSKINIQN